MKEFNRVEDAIAYVYETASRYADDGVVNNIGGPFGAGIVLVDNDIYKVISVERNTVISTNDPTCHAEVNAIRDACNKLRTPFLDNCI